MPSVYTYITANIKTGQVVEEVPLRSVKWGKELNGPGTFEGSIDADHPKASRDVVHPGARFLYVLRDGVPVWGGILWIARNTGGTLEVQAQGIWSYYRRRLIKATTTFTNTDQFTIAQTLLDAAADAPGGDIGVAVPNTTCGVLRDRTYYSVERKQLGEAVEQLSAVENGFDFEVATSLSGATFTNNVVFYYPRQGRRLDAVWDVSVHVSLDSWEVDASATANSISGLGSGDGEDALVLDVADPAKLSEYPLLEDTASFKDVVERSTLDAHSRAELTRRSAPTALPELTLLPTSETTVGSFVVGDEVRLRGTRGWPELDGWYRIVGYNVEVSDDGDEKVKVTVLDAEQVPQ